MGDCYRCLPWQRSVQLRWPTRSSNRQSTSCPSEEEFAETTQSIQAWITEKATWIQELTGNKEIQEKSRQPRGDQGCRHLDLHQREGVSRSGWKFLWVSRLPARLHHGADLPVLFSQGHACHPRAMGRLCPAARIPLSKTRSSTFCAKSNGYLIAFFRGQVLVSIIDGLLVGIALFFVPEMGRYAIIFAVLLAILGVIPFVGFIITLVPAVALAWAHTGSWQVPFGRGSDPHHRAAVRRPGDPNRALLANRLGLHPLTVIFSVFLWSLIIGGVLGALLASAAYRFGKSPFPQIHLGEQSEHRDPDDLRSRGCSRIGLAQRQSNLGNAVANASRTCKVRLLNSANALRSTTANRRGPPHVAMEPVSVRPDHRSCVGQFNRRCRGSHGRLEFCVQPE